MGGAKLDDFGLAGDHSLSLQTNSVALQEVRSVYVEDFSTRTAYSATQNLVWDAVSHQITLSLQDVIAQSEVVVATNAQSAVNDSIYVVWSDQRNSHSDIYAQRLDMTGNRLWPEDRRVNNDDGIDAQSNPSAAVDGAGNLWVAWNDRRNGRNDIYAQALDKAGNPRWADDVRVNASEANGIHAMPAVALTANNQAIVVWHNNRTGNYDIYAQTLALNGERLWVADLQVSDDSTASAQTDPAVAVTPTGEAMVAWLDKRSGQGEIYLQRLNINGQRTWAADVRANDNNQPTQKRPLLVNDSSGGVFVTWLGEIDGNLYAQRIGSAGKNVWNSALRVNADAGVVYNETPPAMTGVASGAAVIAWRRSNDGSLYSQQIDAAGNHLWRTERLLAAGSNQSPCDFPALAIAVENRLVGAWLDRRGGADGDVFAHQWLLTGAEGWAHPMQVNQASGAVEQLYPAISTAIDDALFIVWQDWRLGTPALYAQRYENSGVRQWAQAGVRINRKDGGSQAQMIPALAALPDGGALIAWSDVRTGSPRLYTQAIDSASNLRWEEDRPVSATAGSSQDNTNRQQLNPALAVDGQGRIFVAWQETEASISSIRLQRLDEHGAPQWNDGVSVSKSSSQRFVQMTPASEGGVVIAWLDLQGFSANLYVQSVDANGAARWAAPIQANEFEGLVDPFTEPGLASNRQGEIALAWLDRRANNLYYQRLNPAGARQLASEIKVNSGQSGLSPVPSLVLNDASQATLAWQQRYLGQLTAVAQRFDASGKGIWGTPQTPFIPLSATSPVISQWRPRLAADSNDKLFVGWYDLRHANADVYIHQINGAGQRVWENEQAILGSDRFYHSAGMASSTTVDTMTEPIVGALLLADQQPNGGRILFELSNNGGVTWAAVAPGVSHVFTSSGSDLRWRASLLADPGRPQISPVVSGLHIDYTNALSPVPGDAYEIDSTCAQAWPLSANGEVQARSLHLAEDIDWAKLTLNAGVTYTLQAQSNTPLAGIDLALFDDCRASETLIGHIDQLTFTPARTGVYVLRLRSAASNNPKLTPIGYWLAAQPALPQPEAQGLAILAAGRQFITDTDYVHVQQATTLAYRTLLAHGYTQNTIRYFSHEAAPDLNSNGQFDEVTGTPSLAALQQAIQQWAAEQRGEQPRQLLIYLAGAGMNGQLWLDEGQALTPALLDLWLDNLEQWGNVASVTLIVEGRQTGQWLAGDLSSSRRLLLSATSANGAAWRSEAGLLFANLFWPLFDRAKLTQAWLASRNSLYELGLACSAALTVTQSATACQQPMLDGDGHFALPGAPGLSPPVIRTVQVTTDTKALTVTVTLSTANAAAASPLQVRVYLYPAAELPAEDSATLPLLPVALPLLPGNEQGAFTGSLSLPAQPGFYRLIVYAWEESPSGALAAQPFVVLYRAGRLLFLPIINR